MWKKLILYFIGFIFFFGNINNSIKYKIETYFDTKINYDMLYLIDFIIVLLFYTFIKANVFVFVINISLILFMILAFFNSYYILEKCDTTGKQFESFIVISLLLLGVFLYLNKDKTLGDCSLLTFSKLIMLLSLILSFMYKLDDLLVLSFILFLYVNKLF